MYVCMYVCMYVYIHIYVCMYVCTYVCMYVCIYVYIYNIFGCFRLVSFILFNPPNNYHIYLFSRHFSDTKKEIKKVFQNRTWNVLPSI